MDVPPYRMGLGFCFGLAFFFFSLFKEKKIIKVRFLYSLDHGSNSSHLCSKSSSHLICWVVTRASSEVQRLQPREGQGWNFSSATCFQGQLHSRLRRGAQRGALCQGSLRRRVPATALSSQVCYLLKKAVVSPGTFSFRSHWPGHAGSESPLPPQQQHDEGYSLRFCSLPCASALSV